MQLPGFIDSHLHFLGIGYSAFLVDLSECKSIKEIQQKLLNSPRHFIVIGRGWNQESFLEKRMISKEDLDAVFTQIPMVLIRTCGHIIVVNSKMLELASISSKTSQIEGGTFDFVSGVFTEKAIQLVYKAMPSPSREDLQQYFIKANEILLSNGITSVASDDFSTFSIDYEEIISVLLELYEKNLIQVRVTEQVHLATLPLLIDFIQKGYVNKKIGKLRMGPLKLLADGSLGGRTALLKEPYSDDPSNKGIQSFSSKELFDFIHLADSNGMDVAIHAIGDLAIEQVIDAISASLQITKRTNHKHSIIHAQMATLSQIAKMKKYNIGAIVQPIFLNSDIQIIKKRIGNRYLESYLFSSMAKLGLRVGFSTDSPVESVNPFHNLYLALSRTSMKTPSLGIFLKNECFTLKEAMACYHNANLAYTYQENTEEADYIVIDTDLINCTLEELKNACVLETYIASTLVYKKKEE
ncbi:MAG: amidohydrolase [Firmicutes bacterium]|nr:amidohydrolase [Bacillota bacterium]